MDQLQTFVVCHQECPVAMREMAEVVKDGTAVTAPTAYRTKYCVKKT